MGWFSEWETVSRKLVRSRTASSAVTKGTGLKELALSQPKKGAPMQNGGFRTFPVGKRVCTAFWSLAFGAFNDSLVSYVVNEYIISSSSNPFDSLQPDSLAASAMLIINQACRGQRDDKRQIK